MHDDPAAYGTIELLFDALGLPVLLIPGNHDVPGEMARRLARAPFQVGGEYRTTNGWQVLLLESWFADSEDGEGQLGDGQIAAVEHALAQHARTARVRFPAPPADTDGIPGLDALGLLDAADFLAHRDAPPARARASPGVTRTRPSTSIRGNVRLMCTPATACSSARGSRVSDRRSAAGLSRDRPGADGSIATEVVWLEGYRTTDAGNRHAPG